MTARRGFLIGFGIVAIVLTAAIGWQIYQVRDTCMNVLGGGSCPTLADVGDVRYTVSTGLDLIDIEPALSPHGTIRQTNAPRAFEGSTVYAVRDIDPQVLLVARANESFDPGDGAYRLLLVQYGDRSSMYPTLCDYLTEARRAAQSECD